mgnify:CR=1 FL=1
MIPANKPLICKTQTGGREEVLQILSGLYPNRQIQLVFSGRQGLDVIYQNLYQKYGTLSVAVSPLTCFEALYPIIRNNHRIELVDINPDTLNMDETCIPEDVQVIQPIHFGGNPQDMEKITSLADNNDMIVVEDCAQGFGSCYDNQPVGTFGDYAVFSLMKNLYALGGGFTLSTDTLTMPKYTPLGHIPTAYRILKRFIESNNTYNSKIYNFILYRFLLSTRPQNLDFIFAENTINETILNSICSQLQNSEHLIEQRIVVAKHIIENVSNPVLKAQIVHPKSRTNYTRLFFTLEGKDLKSTIKDLREKGIGANHLTQDSIRYYQEPISENAVLKKFFKPNVLKNYLDLHDRVLSVPISPNISKNEVSYIISELEQI